MLYCRRYELLNIWPRLYFPYCINPTSKLFAGHILIGQSLWPRVMTMAEVIIQPPLRPRHPLTTPESLLWYSRRSSRSWSVISLSWIREPLGLCVQDHHRHHPGQWGDHAGGQRLEVRGHRAGQAVPDGLHPVHADRHRGAVQRRPPHPGHISWWHWGAGDPNKIVLLCVLYWDRILRTPTGAK